MIKRTYDAELINEATKEFQYDFDPKEWVEDHKNIALVSNDDLNLLQYQTQGVYIGHFFYTSRGREALKTAREMLDYIFDLPEVHTLIGMTPVEKLGARWLTRKLGFQSFGIVETIPGECELFVLTKHEHKKDQA